MSPVTSFDLLSSGIDYLCEEMPAPPLWNQVCSNVCIRLHSLCLLQWEGMAAMGAVYTSKVGLYMVLLFSSETFARCSTGHA